MKDLATETRLDVIHRTITSVYQPVEPRALAGLVEKNLREWDVYHALEKWQRSGEL